MGDSYKLPDDALDRISISNISVGPDSPDITTELEKLKLENERLELKSKTQDLSHRKKFTITIFAIMVAWLVFIGFIALINGFGSFWGHAFRLDTSVMVALTGTTTINLIGLCYVVAKYLFRFK